MTDQDLDFNWTPVEGPGDRYCSRRCGCGCKKSDFLKATQDAGALCALLGPNWEPRIWENGGWHHSASIGQAYGRSPNISVSRKSKLTGTHFITANLTHLHQVWGHWEDPVEGVKEILATLLDQATSIQQEMVQLLKDAS